MSYRVAGSLEFVTKLPTPSDRVLKISRKANGRILGDASLIVTPVFAKEHKALIKQIFPLKIEIFFQTKEIVDWTNQNTQRNLANFYLKKWRQSKSNRWRLVSFDFSVDFQL